MMKKYIAILAVAAFTGVQTGRAELLGLGKITTDGSLEISGQQANNETDANDSADDSRGAVNTRLRVGLNADVAKGVKGRVEAVRNSQSGPTVVQYGDGASTVAAEEAAIAFQNAYLDIEDFLMTDSFRIGRQYGGRPGDLLVYYGPVNDDSLTVAALDGVTVTKKLGKINTLFGTGKVREDDAVANTDAGDVGATATADEANVTWLILSSDELFPTVKVPLEFGFYSGTSHGTGDVKNTAGGAGVSDDINLTIMDFRAGYSLMDDWVKLGLEYAMNGGQANGVGTAGSASNFKGSALLLSASYDNKDNGWGAHLKYANASGDDPTTANATADDDTFHDFRVLGWAVSDYRYGEIMSYDNTAIGALAGGPLVGGGLDTGGVFGAANTGPGLNVINLGGHYVLPVMDNKVTAKLDYYVAKVNETPAGVDDGVGNEIDLTLNYAHSEAILASLGYATFSPDKGLLNGFAGTANVPDDAVTKIFAKLMVKWGGERQY